MLPFDVDLLEQGIGQARDVLWGGPLLIMLLGVGLYQTWQTRGVQFRFLGQAFKLILRVPEAAAKGEHRPKGDIPAFQSLMTALAGAIGTGNITGIATAVATGGFGALFWMWVMACFGMATAYSETLLAVHYREKNAKGDMSGGPMYALFKGLRSKKLAFCYALFAGVAALGIGCMVQSNSVVDAVTDVFPFNRMYCGIVLAFLTGAVIIGGVKSIGRVAGVLVPIMASVYVLSGIFILGYHHDRILPAFKLILSSAFTGQAAVGGFLGSSILMAVQNGVQYGIFANEAGLGSLAIAGASAKTNHPAEQGMRSMGGVFFATMVVCTLTGLVLAVTQILGATNASGELLKGSPLAIAAFGSVHDGLRYVVMFGLVLFAFTTMLAWAYYGEKCFEYLFGLKIAYGYRWLFTLAVLLGAILKLDLVWVIANLASALMAFPNLIAIVMLSKDVRELTADYISQISPTSDRAGSTLPSMSVL